MNHPSIYRLAFLLFALALPAIAVGQPPPHAQGSPPPFNQEDCTFSDGRTVCEGEVLGEGQFLMTLTTPGGSCEDGGQTMNKYDLIAVSSYVLRVVYYGASHIVESQEVLASNGTTVLWEYQYSYCQS